MRSTASIMLQTLAVAFLRESCLAFLARSRIFAGFMRVSSGADVSADDAQGAAQATDGKTDEVILYAPKAAAGSGFFKVIRN